MKINVYIDNFKQLGRRALCLLGLTLINLTSDGLAEIDSKIENLEPKRMQILDQQSLLDIKDHPDRVICIIVAIAIALGIYKNIKDTSFKSTKHNKFINRPKSTKHDKFTNRLSRRR